jgi:hypothetical protein
VLFCYVLLRWLLELVTLRRAMFKDILDFRARVLVTQGQALVTGGDVDR